MISPTGDNMFPLMEDLLTRTSKRQQALASNVANLDTPGYHSKDFSFDEQLASITMSATSAAHITPLENTTSAHMYEVGSPEKQNGNNVDLEREMTEITKNGLQYITLVQYLNQKIKTLRSAITGGGQG
jgi:flagellar basal-body rod protein FlgB